MYCFFSMRPTWHSSITFWCGQHIITSSPGHWNNNPSKHPFKILLKSQSKDKQNTNPICINEHNRSLYHESFKRKKQNPKETQSGHSFFPSNWASQSVSSSPIPQLPFLAKRSVICVAVSNVDPFSGRCCC